MGTMLLAPRGAARSAATRMFANMYLAYDALSDGMKRLLAGLIGPSTRRPKRT